MKRLAFVFCLAIASVCNALLTAQDRPGEHSIVYAEAGRFGGWPANHGIWSWGDEILVGFSAGYHKDLGNERHNIDREKPEEHLFARSMDGGATWRIEHPAGKGGPIAAGRALHGVANPDLQEKPWKELSAAIQFDHPDFVMTVRMMDNHVGPSRFYYSYDRGKNWQGPYRLPDVGTKGIAARTDYVVHGRNDCSLIVTAAKENLREGRPCCLRTTDGGRTWQFVAWIGDEPKGYSIMPSTVAISAREWLTAIRCRYEKKSWIEIYRSVDHGTTWQKEKNAVDDLGEGNPASMIRLADGRICITYGYRAAPFGIRARISNDQGRTWGNEIQLRDDGGGRDVGYPRTVQRADGKLVTVYYFHDTPKGERYIAATIWSANSHQQ